MRNQLELRDLHGSLEHSKGYTQTSCRPKESRGNLVVEGSYAGLQVGWLLSIFLYLHLSPFLVQLLVKAGRYSGALLSQRGVDSKCMLVVFDLRHQLVV